MDALGTTEILPGRRKRKLSQNNPPTQKSSLPLSTSAATACTLPSLTEEKKTVVPSVSVSLVFLFLCFIFEL